MPVGMHDVPCPVLEIIPWPSSFSFHTRNSRTVSQTVPAAAAHCCCTMIEIVGCREDSSRVSSDGSSAGRNRQISAHVCTKSMGHVERDLPVWRTGGVGLLTRMPLFLIRSDQHGFARNRCVYCQVSRVVSAKPLKPAFSSSL